MKRAKLAPKPVSQGDAYYSGYNSARAREPYKAAETFEWKAGYRDAMKDAKQ